MEILSGKKRYPISILIILLALILLNTPYVFAGQQALPPGYGYGDISSGPGLLTPALPTYALSLSFSPNTFWVPRGLSKTTATTIINNGASAFVATGCRLTIKWSTGQTVIGICTWSTYSYKAHTSYRGSFYFAVGFTAPLGISTWTVVITGTVNGTPMQSQPAVATITITP